MKTPYFLLVLVIATSLYGCKKSEAQSSDPVIEVISVTDMETALRAENVQLVDVRTKREFAQNHIKNAKNIVYQSKDWAAQVAALDKDKPVYVYCAKGGRSAKCSALLEEAGFAKVYDLDGGITQWISDDKPIE